MANINMPNGFTPCDLSGAKVSAGKVRRYYKDTTAGVIAIGDPVVRVVSSSDPKGGPEIVRATTGSYITGVVVGIQPHPDRPGRHGYLAAADVGYVYVDDDPDSLFLVQETGAGTALADTDVGKHIDSVTALDGDTTLERSKYQIDNNAKATDNTWIIVQRDPNSTVGTYAKWIVRANLHTEANAGATNVKEI